MKGERGYIMPQLFPLRSLEFSGQTRTTKSNEVFDGSRKRPHAHHLKDLTVGILTQSCHPLKAWVLNLYLFFGAL